MPYKKEAYKTSCTLGMNNTNMAWNKKAKRKFFKF
jgi:hypothetical protein